MECERIVCSLVKFVLLNCLVIFSKDPSRDQIVCLLDDGEFQLPCPMAEEISCCNLTQITDADDCLCGTCPTIEPQTKSSRTEPTTVTKAKMITSTYTTNTNARTTLKGAENDTFSATLSSNPRKFNTGYLLIILLPSVTIIAVIIVIGLLLSQQLKSFMTSMRMNRRMRRNRRIRTRVIQEHHQGTEELQLI